MHLLLFPIHANLLPHPSRSSPPSSLSNPEPNTNPIFRDATQRNNRAPSRRTYSPLHILSRRGMAIFIPGCVCWVPRAMSGV
ncbi:hypothetical protein EYC84_011018 [Monilinia fructicola]|uniref:Uncharacterized protein n=1 Tax=Monilinia fructicola TaxID=38448 RepID=A0A5M9JDL0_MONFR|nr:hypothetical protein EYC84_011018 [Monilinia fructicola]